MTGSGQPLDKTCLSFSRCLVPIRSHRRTGSPGWIERYKNLWRIGHFYKITVPAEARITLKILLVNCSSKRKSKYFRMEFTKKSIDSRPLKTVFPLVVPQDSNKGILSLLQTNHLQWDASFTQITLVTSDASLIRRLRSFASGCKKFHEVP